MGLPMALNLQTHLTHTNAPPLHFYNRTPTHSAPLHELGGTPSPNIQDLLMKINICFLAVTDDNAVKSIINTMIEFPDHIRNKIIVDTTTVHPETSSWAQKCLRAVGAGYIASPVFGASPVAKEGKLLFVMAGREEDVRGVEGFVVGVMGRKVVKVGGDGDVGRASLLKCTG